MYVLIESLSRKPRKLKTKTLKEMKQKLLNDIYARVYDWYVDKHTYRDLYHTNNSLKSINYVLRNDLWFEILHIK